MYVKTMLNLKGHINTNTYMKIKSNYSIIGLFSKGIYIDNNDSILMIHDTEYGDIPFGIAIDNFSGLKLNEYLNAQDSVIFENKKMFFYRHGEIILCINLIQHETIQDNNCLIDKNILINIAKKNIIESQKGFFRDYFLKNNVNTHDDLFNDLDNKKIFDVSTTRMVLLKIIGLGPGLTPSGDDFIFGFLYFTMNICCNKNKFVNEICKFICEDAPIRTNKISCLYLKSIIDRGYFSILSDICFAKDELSLQKSINRLLKVGNNSGCDMLCGMLYAALYAE